MLAKRLAVVTGECHQRLPLCAGLQNRRKKRLDRRVGSGDFSQVWCGLVAAGEWLWGFVWKVRLVDVNPGEPRPITRRRGANTPNPLESCSDGFGPSSFWN